MEEEKDVSNTDMEEEGDVSDDARTVTNGAAAAADPNEMPDGVSEDQLHKLMGSRRAKLGSVTRKKNDILSLMKDGTFEDVKDAYEMFHKILAEFMELQVHVQMCLPVAERDADHINWYEPKLLLFKEFISEAETWVETNRVHATQPFHSTQLGRHEGLSLESVDRESVTSKRSAASSRASARARIMAEAERAALLARAACLDEKYALDLEELQLKARKEKHAVDSDLAAATAKLNVLNELEESSSRTSKRAQQTLDHFSPLALTDNEESALGAHGLIGARPHPPAVSPVPEKPAQLPTVEPITEASRGEQHSEPRRGGGAEAEQHQGSRRGAVQHQGLRRGDVGRHPDLSPHTRSVRAHQHHYASQGALGTDARQDLESGRREGDHSETSVLSDILRRQNDITQYLVGQQQLSLLPTRDIPTFDGDALAYRSFIRAFEHNIESRTSSNQDRLYFLEQYTAGRPRDLVRSCMHMDHQRGFREAKMLLHKHFGHEMKIATAYLEKALSWNHLKAEDGRALHAYGIFLRECYNVMQDIEFLMELETPSNMRAIVAKLPFKLRDKWRSAACALLDRTKQRAKFMDLVEFVENQANIALDPIFGDIQDPVSHKSGPTLKHKAKSQVKGSSFATTITPATSTTETEHNIKTKSKSTSHQAVRQENVPSASAFEQPCLFCKGEHIMLLCHTLKNKPNKEKVEFLKTKGLCFGCLSKGHLGKTCSKRMTCQTCQQKHPSILHIDRKPTQSSGATNDAEGEPAVTALVSLDTARHTGAGSSGSDCMLAIVPVQVKMSKGNRTVNTYAFLDPGSSATFCTEALMDELKAKGNKADILLTTLAQKRSIHSHKISGMEVAGLEENAFLRLPDVYTHESIPVTHKNIPSQEDIQKWPYLNNVLVKRINADIGLLIGVNAPKALEPWEIVNSVGNGPYAVKTMFGWVVNGPLNCSSMDEHGPRSLSVNRTSISSVEELLIQQYNQDFTEHSYEKKEMSAEDKQFMKIVSDSATLKDEHYYLKLPFRNVDVVLPNNRQIAEQRAHHLLKKFKRNESFHQEYSAFLNDVIEKGYAEPVPKEALMRKDGRVWYLPHHGVYHPRKGKIRVVFDCGAPFHGTSLNKELLQGPDLTNTLLGVLLRFRQGPVALMADIEAMFHQVRVDSEDKDFLRFLWWPNGDTTQPLADFRMTVHLFGAVSSPSCASFALKQTAKDNYEKYSDDVISTVNNNFYVDDCLKSVDSVEQAICLYRDLKELCARGGFGLTKWTSNSRSVLASIPVEERAKELKQLDLDREHLPVERALGAQWNIEQDTFTFNMSLKSQPTTRRGILSMVSSIYDPLGFLSPVVLVAKKILQDLCRIKCGWDDRIPDALSMQWQKWLAELNHLSSFQVSRCVIPDGFGRIKSAQLHHFCDASESGYGTVSYLRLENHNNNTHVAFLTGKARVTPLKHISIPRLELAAAVLGARMDRLLKAELQITTEDSVFWTDSMSVLRYLANRNQRFQTFVANRISTIQALTNMSQWRHVSSKLNPADDASRGLKADALLSSKRWINGPDFLALPATQWPKSAALGPIPAGDPEVRKDITVCSTEVKMEDNPTCQLIQYFSTWNRLKTAVAWFLKLKTMLKELSLARKKNPLVKPQPASIQRLSVEDLKQAEKALVLYVQNQCFSEEIDILSKNKSYIGKSSKIHRLNPIMVDGILRVGGRLSRAAMPEETKHQMILPKKHHVSDLILRHVHEQVGHSGRNHTLSKLRRRFWIPQANAAARKMLKQCIFCQRQNAKVGEQLMSDLPKDRVSVDLPPFTHTGIDYFGPILVKRGRSTVKRYGVIFTCLACRAVHLEMAYSLETDSCINALRRFICRRGKVSEIRSDNGTNLVGANRELKQALKELDDDKIHKTLLKEDIKWTFNPPLGAHHGGTWERLIRIIKKVLRSVLKEQTLDEEGLQTALCEVEAILNDRPLTPMSDDPGDLEALTPNHLLQLKCKPSLPPGIFKKEDLYCRRRWRQVQYIADLFWRRWAKEYLPLLQERQKWNRPRRSLSPGDLVLIVDETAPRNSWLMGRILQTMPDSKGLVRQVRVKTKYSILDRPVTKLCLLLEAAT